MKHLLGLVFVLALVVLIAPHSAMAQGGDELIILNDATPGIDVVISLAPGTTGAIAMEMRHVSVTLTDAQGNTVFQTTDPRIQELELRFAPDSQPHTLTVERLPGMVEGFVRLHAMPDLTDLGVEAVLVNADTLAMAQEQDHLLNIDTPSNMVKLTSASEEPVAIATTFPGAEVMWQLADSQGVAVATLYAGAVDGISLVAEGGDYEVSMLNTTPDRETTANVRVMPVPSDVVAALIPATTATDVTSPAASSASQVALCNTTINVASVNLRSGPGTGYSVLSYAYRGDSLQVGGTNTIGNWVVVALEDGSTGWMFRRLGDEQGGCNTLTVFDVPLRDAPTPAVVVQTIPGQTTTVPASGGGFDDDDHDDDDDDDDHDDDDDDDDDDD